MDRRPGSPRLMDVAGMLLAFGLVLVTTIFVRGETPPDPFAIARPAAPAPLALASGAVTPAAGARHQATAALR
ncbi:hypothetical protein E8L99_06430 [Phreatobacter aquaticus]|uniref:Uncharacterized protein n=1 Tax=Phreatobacter aquaticus TaxID=2570229 RepID=A0A4D7QFK3_9HYPH|nr:hypothetical protein [Phreatobacter aquaticus]QCK85431.1 hypothetical protein E8L99_06430 [Phreatobacter aquaticus]